MGVTVDRAEEGGEKNRRQELQRGQKETRGDDGYVYYLDHGDGFMGVNICHDMMRFKYVNYTSIKLV